MMISDTIKIIFLLSMLFLSLFLSLSFVGQALASDNESISSGNESILSENNEGISSDNESIPSGNNESISFGNEGSSLEENECTTCHNTAISSQRASATQVKCNNCHGSGHGIEHTINGREDYHRIHSGIDRGNKKCAHCHYTPDCAACHISHIPGTESCRSCHGSLLSPNGHAEVRSDFSRGKHSWLGRCSTCHSGDKLSLAGSYVADLSESNDLCDICHSTQMNDMSQGEHGEDGNKCVACHNPHTTYTVGAAVFASESVGFDWNRLNGTSIIDGTKSIFSSKNGLIIAIICLLGIVSVSEHLMTKHEKDKVILTDNLRIIHDKEHSEVLKIDIFALSVADQIFATIERMNIKVLGATMKNTKHNTLVLFLDFSTSTKSKEELLENVNEFSNVISAEYSDNYEI